MTLVNRNHLSRPSTESVITARSVGKRYLMYANPQDRLKQALWRGKKQFFREFWALNDVSFRIEGGETVGIVGSNGSGKSTLLQLICGIHNPTVGELEVSGRVAALLELGAGFNPEFSGEENIRVNAAILGLSPSQIAKNMDAIIAFADIGEFISQPVKLYSSGMYVRLAFATAINVDADILVVDEALAVGDARFRQKCLHRIKAFCRKGTALFVSHDTEAITELCSRAIWIERGVIQMDGRPKQVVEKYLEFMYGSDSQPAALEVDDKRTPEKADLSGFEKIDANIRQFGNRKATIEALQIAMPGAAKGVLHAGRPCDICMLVKAHERVRQPIAGYLVKDRLGRTILGENNETAQTPLPSMEKGEYYRVTFSIAQWPVLQAGEYALSVAVADGTNEAHNQCHWLHDAAVFTNIPARTVVGVVAVPETRITSRNLAVHNST